jgi:hypothetical protein
MRTKSNLASCLIASSSRQPTDGGNDNRAKVKNDGSGISPNTFEPLSLSKAVLKAAARESAMGYFRPIRPVLPAGLCSR